MWILLYFSPLTWYIFHKWILFIYDISDIDSLFCICYKCQIFSSQAYVLAWAQSVDKQHGIIVVTIHFDTANGMRKRKDKLIMDFKRGGN